MRYVDIPPTWLGLALAVMVAEAQVTGGATVPAPAAILGWTFVMSGLGLMAGALLSFVGHRTSPIPHTDPVAIITTGVFRISRNPIYLGDALVLLGAGLILGAFATVVLLPAFVGLITHRFILPEEARLSRVFPEEWAAYSARVRRWM